MKKKFALISVSLIGAACVGLCACSGYDNGDNWGAPNAPNDFAAGNYDYNSVIRKRVQDGRSRAVLLLLVGQKHGNLFACKAADKQRYANCARQRAY